VVPRNVTPMIADLILVTILGPSRTQYFHLIVTFSTALRRRPPL
jgi:hypothetical protein